MNLIDAWLATAPGTAADALRELNAALGRRYTSSHLSRWRRGVETPRPDVVRFMSERVAPSVIEEVLSVRPTEAETARILDRLTP
jgi:hypothetical protein